MAYLRDIPKPKCQCGATATVELFNHRNACNGQFCRSCGRRELREQERREKEGR